LVILAAMARHTSVVGCRLRSGLRDGTETLSLRRWSTARRAFLPDELMWHSEFGRFLYSIRDYGILCMDCCVTLATILLWTFFKDIFHSE